MDNTLGKGMSEEEPLSSALQENLLTLLCWDKNSSVTVRRLVQPSLFEGAIFREIATEAITYIDQFQTAPCDHISDLLEDTLKGNNKQKAKLVASVLRSMKHAYKDMNTEYILSQLTKFVRRQRLKEAVVGAVKSLERNKVDEAEVLLEGALRNKLDIFSPGTLLSNTDQALSFFDNLAPALPLGIPALDRNNIGPAPKELFTFIAQTGRGKSWFLGHVAKQAIIHRKNVVFISLEMSEQRIAQRFIQALFSYAKTGNAPQGRRDVRLPSFKKNEDGILVDFAFKDTSRPALNAPHAQKILRKKLDRMGGRIPLIIKQFPTGKLDMNGLIAYIDGLERLHNFIPEILIVDYGDLMSHRAEFNRIDLEKIYQDLRALAIERNISVCTGSQGNRLGEDAKIITLKNVAEAIGKVQVSDTVLTYTQTDAEKTHGLARLFVAKSRNDSSGFTVLISQSYQIGQFCIDSANMVNQSDYFDKMGEL